MLDYIPFCIFSFVMPSHPPVKNCIVQLVIYPIEYNQ